MLGYLVIAGFMALFMAGFPIVYAILIPCIGYVLIEDLPVTLLAQRVTYALDSFPLVAVPLFIFVGNLMNLSGITDRIFNFADTLFSRIHGGLAQVNILGSLIFSGISGAALADIAGLGRVEIKAMRERGFDAPFAAAVTASSSLLGPIFPPSIPLIVYGSATSVSVVQLLLAGILPAVVCTIFLMIAAGIVSHHPSQAAWRSWPSFYAVSAEDRTINPDLQRHMAARMNARTVEIHASHLSLISHSHEVTKLILDAGQSNHLAQQLRHFEQCGTSHP
jgi:tripartite ATP-independent transporter DctM subunit